MMQISRTIIVLCLISLSTTAHAVDWEHIIDTEDGAIFVDLDSYNDDATYSTITTKTRYKSPQTIQTAPHKRYIDKLVTAQFDCKQHTINILSIVLHDKKGNIVAREIPPAHLSPLVNKSDQGVETLVCQVRKMVKG